MQKSELKIAAVLEWVDTEAPGSFDPSFVHSLDEAFKKYGRLTERQESALDNIIEKFRIGEDT